MESQTQQAAEAKHQTLVLQVRYLGSHRPFIDPHALASATLASVKPAVLAFFGLVEGAGKVYTFAAAGVPLTDQSVTLGHLADGKHELKLDLVEQLVQG